MAEEYANTEHPLFMQQVPSDLSSCPDLEALQQIVLEGEDNESLALNYKKIGNDYVKEGARFYMAAISSYTNGIAAKSKDPVLNSTLYANRALVYLNKGFNPRVEAVSFCHEYAKTKYPNVQDWHQMLLENPTYSSLYNRILEKIKAAQVAKKRLQASKVPNVVPNVRDELERIGISLLKPLYQIPQQQDPVLYFKEGAFHASCLFIFDEYQRSDFIKDFNYECSIFDYLEAMFPEERNADGFEIQNAKAHLEIETEKLVILELNEPLINVARRLGIAFEIASIHLVRSTTDISAFGFFIVNH
ncbi:Tetratricopeptide-like helical domain superfamily [Babesia duncani]|nr:Tetratricopeptide-like helical domain superfamily [Babesia duncani]